MLTVGLVLKKIDGFSFILAILLLIFFISFIFFDLEIGTGLVDQRAHA
jgi:hypothetical protein